MALGKCPCCEVLRQENEHLRKWIDRLMGEMHPDPNQPRDIEPEHLDAPADDLGDGVEKIQFGE